MSPPAAKRLTRLALIFGGYIVLATALNSLWPQVHLTPPVRGWFYDPSVPAMTPIGVDLRIFIEAAQKMSHGINPLYDNYNSPPLTAAVFLPFAFLSPERAYTTQFVLIVLENFIALVLIFLLARPTPSDREGDPPVLVGLILLVVCFSQFTGYPLGFSLERGNYDSLALLLICGGLMAVKRHPSASWLHVLCFSLAAHLKVYPAILLFIPLWQRGWRALPPIVVINLGLLFCFGFGRGIEFLVGLYRYSYLLEPYIWNGNHSIVAFSTLELEPRLRGVLADVSAHRLGLMLAALVPIALWGHGTWKLLRRGREHILAAAALAVPLMCVIPSTSHDYKLVLIALPAFFCLASHGRRYVEQGATGPLLAVAGTLLCLLFLGRSVLFPVLIFTANKYPAIVLLELLTYLAVLQLPAGMPKPPPAGSG